MGLGRGIELATDTQFRELSNFATPPRAGTVTAIEPSGQVRVATNDPDGGDVLAWPLNGFTYAVDDVVYIAFAENSPDSAIVLGSRSPAPTLDPDALAGQFVELSGDQTVSGVKTFSNRITGSAGAEVAGNTTATDFIARFIENGVTAEGSAVLTTNADKGIGVFGDGGAYYVARDVTNDIEFINGTSSVGAGFTGTGTEHDLQLRTGNVVRAVIAHVTAFFGFGTMSPQGKVHAHDGTAGLIFVSKTGIVNVAQTLIPNGTGDVTGGITGFFVVNDGGGAVANTFTLLPGDFVDVVVGGYTLRLALSAAGALTAVRQSGVGTATLAILGVWL